MAKITKINHIALVVEDIDAAMDFWSRSLGIGLGHIEDVPQEGSKVAFLPLEASEIELVQPTSADSGVARYLGKRGPGMHHLCLEVDDIQEILTELKEKGVQLLHEMPAEREDGRKYAFIHPKAANGVLVELYQLPSDPAHPFPGLETDRLVLRQFKPADAPMVFGMYTHPDLVHWLEHEPMGSLEEAENRVHNRIRLFENGMGCRWAITLKPDIDQVVGSCGYFSVRVGTQTVEMGFELHPDYWRQGIMTEALTAILDYSFSADGLLPVHRVEALVDPGNEASIELLGKLGFVNESLRREFGYWKGAHRDVITFALLKRDWKK